MTRLESIIPQKPNKWPARFGMLLVFLGLFAFFFAALSSIDPAALCEDVNCTDVLLAPYWAFGSIGVIAISAGFILVSSYSKDRGLG